MLITLAGHKTIHRHGLLVVLFENKAQCNSLDHQKYIPILLHGRGNTHNLIYNHHILIYGCGLAYVPLYLSHNLNRRENHGLVEIIISCMKSHCSTKLNSPLTYKMHSKYHKCGSGRGSFYLTILS